MKIALALRAATTLAVLTLTPACKDDGNPTMPGGPPRTWADSMFGTANVAWLTSDTVGAGSMRPEVDGSRVYFQREEDITGEYQILGPSRLVALDRETGARLWSNQIQSSKNAAIAGRFVAAASRDLPVFDRVTGARVAFFRFGGESLSANVASDGGRFYVMSQYGHALAVNPATGAVAWDTFLAGEGQSTPGLGVTVSGEAVAVVLTRYNFVGATQRDTGIVAVLDRATGAVRWRRTLETSITSPALLEPPVVVGGLVIVVTQGHDVRAFSLETGAPRWQADVSFSTQESASNGFAACQGMVIVPTGDLGLVALDAASGQVRWRLGTLQGEGTLRDVQCSHGTVITLGAGLRVFDAATGAQRARFPLVEPDPRPDPFWIKSVVRDEDFLYVGSTFGYTKVRAP